MRRAKRGSRVAHASNGSPSGDEPLSADDASEGFGQLWQKELSILVDGTASPEDVMAYWRAHLNELWPSQVRLLGRPDHMRTDEIVGLELSAGPLKLSTGAVVIETSPTSFTMLAPKGHMFVGWTQLHTEAQGESVRAAVTIEMRASDPLYELVLMLGGHAVEEKFWAQMLKGLAAHFGEPHRVRRRRLRLDRHRHWRRAGNIRDNAAVRTNVRRLRSAVGLGG